MKKYELELFHKTRIGIDSGKQELELIRKTRIGIGNDSKHRKWNWN
jgi:3-methyladenine DNA glycosylase Mpg